MKKTVALALTAALVSATPVFAQTETQKTAAEKTATQSDQTNRMQVLRKALQNAKTPKEKFDANLNISYLRFEQEIYGEAVYYAGEALKIADADFPNDAKRRTKAVVQKSESLRKVGRVSEANALINENVARKSQKGDHIWRDIDGGIAHRFTAMTCPDFVAQMPRQEFHNYSQAGIDVGCSYELISEHKNVVSLYMTKYGGRVKDSDAIKRGGTVLLKRLPDSQKIAVDKLAKFTSGAGNPVYYTQVGYGSVQEGEKYTGAWTQVVGDWILKTRVTWAAELGVGFGEEKSKALFAPNTDRILANFEACKALDAPKSGKKFSSQGASMMAIVLGSLTSSLANEIEKADVDTDAKKLSDDREARAPLITTPAEPTVTCFAGKTSGDEIALGYHPDMNRRYSTYSAVIDDVYYVELEPLAGELSKSKKPQFILKSVNDNAVSIFQIYDGEPAPDMVFEDVVAVVNGEIQALGSAAREDGKNVTINVNPDMVSQGKKK